MPHFSRFLREVGTFLSGSCALLNQKESGEVFLVVFNARFEDFARVLPRCLRPRDSGGIFQIFGNDVLHASGRVIERHSFDLRMLAEEITALVERHRVRQHFLQRAELHSGRGNHVVHNAEKIFGLDKNIAGHEKVGMFSDGSGQGIFDRNDRSLHRSVLYAIEDFRRPRARNHLAAGKHALGRLVTECAEFSLDGDFHREMFLSQCQARTCCLPKAVPSPGKQQFPQRLTPCSDTNLSLRLCPTQAKIGLEWATLGYLLTTIPYS